MCCGLVDCCVALGAEFERCVGEGEEEKEGVRGGRLEVFLPCRFRSANFASLENVELARLGSRPLDLRKRISPFPDLCLSLSRSLSLRWTTTDCASQLSRKTSIVHSRDQRS
jgi:hypothetical protein